MHACLLPGVPVALVCSQEELSSLQGEQPAQHAMQLQLMEGDLSF